MQRESWLGAHKLPLTISVHNPDDYGTVCLVPWLVDPFAFVLDCIAVIPDWEDSTTASKEGQVDYNLADHLCICFPVSWISSTASLVVERITIPLLIRLPTA